MGISPLPGLFAACYLDGRTRRGVFALAAVEQGDPVPGGERGCRQMAAHETGTAEDQEPHS